MKGESNDYQHDMGRGMEIVNANDKSIAPPDLFHACKIGLKYIDKCI